MPAPSLLHFRPYRLDGTGGQLWRHDVVVHLRPKALAVLWELARQVGQMVPKDRLLDTVWADTMVSEGVLTACMRDVRRALGDAARRPRYIETVHRRGYRFVAEVTAFAAAAAPAPLGTDDPPGTVAPPAVEPGEARAPVTGPW